jgi:tetratricopeptide (TPR) repeat protein
MICALVLAFWLMQVRTAAPRLPQRAVALLQSGADAENHHNLDGAIFAFRKATEAAPSAPIVLIKLGQAYMAKGDYAAAIPPLKRAVQLSPGSLPAHRMLGLALLAEGYASEAIPHLQLAHEYGALGIAQLQMNQPGKAVANLQAALAKHPGDPGLLLYLSRAAASLSSESLDMLLSAFPRTARAHQALGQNYYEMKMFPDAVKQYEKAMALQPDLPGLKLELGEIYAASSEWQKAEEEFREETRLQPGNAEAFYRLGDTLLREGKMKEAAAELRRSDLLRPDMPETLYSLARTEAVGDPNRAEHALERVIELEKNTRLAGRAYLLLAQVHRKQGKTSQALREMQEYRRIQALIGRPGE